MKLTIDRGIRALIVVNILALVLLLGAFMLDRITSGPAGHPAQAAEPSPAASIDLMPMGLAHIPTSSSCLLCHETGGEAGLKPIPAIGHPLAGWTACLTCHTDEKLGRKAPGHDGIPEAECTNCHKVAAAGPAITRPHAKLGDQQCLDCHGTVAHLPTSMVGRNQDECWLCHKPASSPPPTQPHPDVAGLTCRSCHRADEAGALPIDHALRGDETCALCHEVQGGDASARPTLPFPSASPSGAPPGG